MDAAQAVQLAEWRRAVSQLYAEARSAGAGERGWERWRAGKQQLYRVHPQSPIPANRRAGYVYQCFAHDPSMRVLAELVAVTPRHVEGDSEVPGMTHVGALHFRMHGADHDLGAYWLDGYAGGLFVPFADVTSGSETYGGGRYAVDTAKGADLGSHSDRTVLDFNYAYAPSCAHDPRWRCPLAPAANRLSIPVRAGECQGFIAG